MTLFRIWIITVLITIIIFIGIINFSLKQAIVISEYHQEHEAFTVIQVLNR